MTTDYSSSASVLPRRSIPVNVVAGTVAATLTSQGITPSASNTVGAGAGVTRQGAVLGAGLSIKGAAGRVYGFTVSNPGAASAWFNLYNATAITLGTTAPLVQVLVPAGQTVTYEVTVGMAFTTGIMVAATDNSAPLSAVAPATALVASVLFI